MAGYRVASGVEPSDLEAYQFAARQVLAYDVVTAQRPRLGVLAAVLPWADRLAADFRELFGYALLATAHHVRLVRRLDGVDDTQRAVFANRQGRPFDRRRLAYLCLVLAAFQRSKVETDLADLVRAFAPAANDIDGLGFDATVTDHKHAVVDVVHWLVDRGALRLSEGSAEAWAHDTERENALYDIDHDICAALFRPSRSLQHLRGVAELLETAPADIHPGGRREQALRRARRLLVEHPVVYDGELDVETAAAVRGPEVAEAVARLTGLVVERRAEGVMLVDPTGRLTDRRFPGRAGAANRVAGLLLAKFADVLDDPDEEPLLTRLPVPSVAQRNAELVARIDAGRPRTRTDTTSVSDAASGTDKVSITDTASDVVPGKASGVALTAPFLPLTRITEIITELYAEFGAAAFTAQWQHDPDGLLREALHLLDDLRLVHRVPGGVLVLPAAARYRNIRAALPVAARREGQGVLALALDTGPGDTGPGDTPPGDTGEEATA